MSRTTITVAAAGLAALPAALFTILASMADNTPDTTLMIVASLLIAGAGAILSHRYVVPIVDICNNGEHFIRGTKRHWSGDSRESQ
jgi:hypothetical protein